MAKLEEFIILESYRNKGYGKALFKYAIEKALETGIVSKGDKVIITSASGVGCAITDTIKLHIL
jgi:GNAT superfamily N-acetyltransferase